MANPVMNAKIYAQITGVALAATAILGIIMNIATTGGTLIADFLVFDWTHNIVHVVLAAVALYVGFANLAGNYVMLYAKVFGIVYLGLGVLGFVPAAVDGLGTALALNLELGENLVHLVIGLWGVIAGFFGTTTGMVTTTTSSAKRI